MGVKALDKFRYFQATGYQPHKAQIEVHQSLTRHRALSNGRRWGKTLLGGKEVEPTAFVLNRFQEPQRGWIVGPEYADCEKEFRVVFDTLKELGVDSVSTKFLSNIENGNMHIKTKWGWDVMCKSAKHPETLVGEGLDFVLLCEAGRLRRKVFTQYIRPALSDKRGWSLMTGVPEIATDQSLLYWGWTRGQDGNRSAWESWRKPSWTNTIMFPGGRNDEEILEAEADLTEDEFRRQYGGEFVERVGRVMKEWDDEVHLKNLSFDPDLPLYFAVDYGYSNPFVWLWIQVDAFDNVYIIGEHYFLHHDVTEICKTMKEHPWTSKVIAFYPDPHEPDDTSVIQRELRIPARTNTGGDVKTRNRMIRDLLKPMPEHAEPEDQQARLIVDRLCTKFAWEMREGYRWPEHKSETRNESELPLDKDNHGPEAISRFVYGYFSVVGTGNRRNCRQTRMRVKSR